MGAAAFWDSPPIAAIDRPPHPDCPLCQVHVLPLEPQELAGPHAGAESEQEESRQLGLDAPGRLEEAVEEVAGNRAVDSRTAVGRQKAADPVRWVLRQQTILVLCGTQHGTQHSKHQPDTGGTGTVVHLPEQKITHLLPCDGGERRVPAESRQKVETERRFVALERTRLHPRRDPREPGSSVRAELQTRMFVGSLKGARQVNSATI